MFKEGDIVKCIDSGNNKWITNNKKYEIFKTLSNMIKIADDKGTKNCYFSRRFIKVNNIVLSKYIKII
jgi:hypothetical protein